MEKKSLFSVLKTESEKTKIILDNILEMLSKRIYIDSKGDKQPLIDIDTVKRLMTDMGDNVFLFDANNGIKFAVKIVYYKVSVIRKQSPLDLFLDEYASYKKIIVVQEYSVRKTNEIQKRNAQIFEEGIMLFDMIKHKDQPEFELLSPKEMAMVKEEYNASEYTMSKMLVNDPVARYFDLSVGDIIRIKRPSPTSGKAIAYRVIV